MPLEKIYTIRYRHMDNIGRAKKGLYQDKVKAESKTEIRRVAKQKRIKICFIREERPGPGRWRRIMRERGEW